MERLASGIERLDEIMGGYPKGRSVLIRGGPGSGKTILGLTFVNTSCRAGMKALFIATEETTEDLAQQASTFGWDLKGFVDSKLLKMVSISEARSQEAELYLDDNLGSQESQARLLLSVIELEDPADYDVIVVDNLGSVVPDLKDSFARRYFDLLCNRLRSWELTSLLVLDEAEEHYATIALHTCYGGISLAKKMNPFNNNHERYLEILKMRSTEIPDNPVKFYFTEKGIELIM